MERGLHVDHTTIFRWVQRYAPELEKRCRPHLKVTNDSWRVDETYIKVKGTWMYLYRAVDSRGNTLEFWLSPTRDSQATKQFFAKALRGVNFVAFDIVEVLPAYDLTQITALLAANVAYEFLSLLASVHLRGHLPDIVGWRTTGSKP
jgi:hypothetical protein